MRKQESPDFSRGESQDKPTTRRTATDESLMLQQRQCIMFVKRLREKHGPSVSARCATATGQTFNYC